MVSMSHVRRVVLSHNWQNLDEWVSALDQLADLTDDEIDTLSSDAVSPEPLTRVAA